MKEIKNKNINWLIIIILTLISFIIANWGFAFRTKEGLCLDLSTIKILLNNTKNIAGYMYIRDSFWLIISGYILLNIIILLILLSIWINSKNKNESIEKILTINKIYHWIYLIFFLNILLFLSGEITFLSNHKLNWNGGYITGMFIFTLLPLSFPLTNLIN